MGYQILADLLAVMHAAFVLFVVFGGLIVWYRHWVVWLHVPAIIWAVIVSSFGLICPLTPWENQLRRLAGGAGYEGGFIEHYLLPLIYPAGLTREIQWLLALFVIIINLAIYWKLIGRRRHDR